jgi:hypothetical protein
MAVNFSMVSGDSRTLTIPITDEGGNNVDVSTAQAIRYGIFKHGGDALVSKSLENGLSVVAHVVTVVLVPADTAALLAGSYPHELEIVTASGEVHTALQGTVTIRKDYIANG